MKHKPSRTVVGGCDQINGAWHAIIEIHAPCHGGQHLNCRIVERNVSLPLESQATAVEMVMEIMAESGLVSDQRSS